MAGAGLSLKARALGLLARREHSRAELERKLVRHGAEPAEIRRVLDELAATGLLDERRAAQALVASQARRFGGARLKQSLRQRGLPPELAAEALAGVAEVAGTELARAREVWRRRFGAPADDAAGRAKQARFLAGRGFAAEVVRQVVRGLDDEVEVADGTAP